MTTTRYGTRRCVLSSSLVATLLRLFEITVLWLGIAAIATAANRNWIGGNADWDGTNGNWSGNDEPDADDVAIFNTANSVDLVNASESISGLTMSDGISISVSAGNVLSVNGTIELSDASTDLFVEAGAIVIADVITINSGAEVTLRDGSLWIIDQTGVGLIDVNNGGELSGNGLILLDESVSAGTQVFNLDGTLTAHSTDGIDLLSLAFATLTITVSDPDGVIDLDGNDENSTINVLRNDTLLLNGGVLDSAYSGTMNLSAGATFSRNEAWAFNGILNTTASGAAATIDGGAFTQTGGSINVDAGESLRISSSTFSTTNGTINNSGHIIFDSATDTNSTNIIGITFNMTGPAASLTVNPGVHVSITSNDIELDGAGTATNVLTIGSLGKLDLSLSGAADQTFTGHIILDRGTLEVITNDNEWSLGGTLSVVGAGAPASLIDGERVTFSATTTIAAGAALAINAPTIYDGALAVTGGGLLIQNTAATANGTPTIEVGSFRANAPVTVNPSATLLVDVGHINDLSDAHQNTFEIDSGTLDVTVADGEWQLGKVGGASGTIYFRQSGITPTLEGASTLRVTQGTIDVDGGATIFMPIVLEQTASNYGTLRFVGEGGLASTAGHLQLRGGDIHDITDDPSVDTELHLIGGLTVSGTAASGVFVDTFRWDLSPTTIEPGAYFGVYADNIEPTGPQKYDNLITINQGTLHLDLGNHASWIMDGYLDLDRGTVGGLNEVTPGGDAIEIGDDAGTDVTLNVSPGTSTFNSFVTFNSDAYVYLESGAQLDMNAGVVFSPVNGANNGVFTGGAGTWLFLGPVTFAEATTIYMPSAYLAFSSDINDNTALIAPVTLSLETMGNFNGLMTISAPGRLTVNLTDPNGEWTIGRTATINTLGNSPSDILLAGSDINHNGTMNVNGDGQIAARLDIGSTGVINIFDADGSLTLSGGSLADPNTISGGEINGPGQLIIAPGTALGGNAAISALINQGTLAPGASPGQITLDVYTQTKTGVLEIELGGTGPNDIDRLVILGEASLAGTLNLLLIDGFVPSAGQSFDILAVAGGVTGAFDTINLPTLPFGLAWSVNDDDPTMFQLLVTDSLPGDYNGDGSVDAADYVVWRKNDGTQPGYDLWRANFGATAAGAAAVARSGDTGSASAAVPEPTSLILLVTAVVAATLRRRLFGTPSVRLLVIALACPLVAVFASPAPAANYSFVKIADSTQLRGFGQNLTINNHGTVAFAATPLVGSRGVFTGAGGPITQIYEYGEAPLGVIDSTSINDSGTVAFMVMLDGPGVDRTIVTSNGGPLTTIAETVFAPFARELIHPVINSQGTVAFREGFSEHDPLRLNFAIYSGSGGPLTLIADSSGPLSATSHAQPLHMNDHGTVAFAASLDGGAFGIVTGNGGPLTTFVASAAGFNGLSEPSINNNGALAFFGQRTGGVMGIYAHSGGTLTTIADSSGPFNTNFGKDALINDLGAVVFRATLDTGGFGLFTGPDPIADKVVQTGDPLFGSTVTAVGRLSQIVDHTFDINDNGDVAFLYELANGMFGIAVARVVVPEPSSMILLMIGVVAATLRRRLFGTRSVRLIVIALACPLVAVFALPATAANYSFINIADSGQFRDIGDISLNNHGTVAFGAGPVAGGQGVYTGAGGPITTIIDNSGAYNNFSSASINDSGMVAFYAKYSFLGEAILTSNGGLVTTIADITMFGPYANLRFPDINSAGTVALRVLYSSGLVNFAIYTGSGGPLTLIADSRGPLELVGATPLHMNDTGTVAFTALLDNDGAGIFTGNGGPLTTILTDTRDFAIGGEPSINAGGTLAFLGVFANGVRGIFTSSGGPVTTVADNSGPFNLFAGGDSRINASGEVAFRATLDAGGSGIFTGPDPVADKVIRTGDPLFGSTVTVVGHFSISGQGTFDFNDNGDVAFHYELANGTIGIAVARIVPEPSSAILLMVGLLGVWRSRRRRHARQPRWRKCVFTRGNN